MRIIVFIASLFIASAVFADDNKHEVCSELSSLAENILGARYDGVPMRELMGVVQDNGMAELTRNLIIVAYERPEYSSDQFQQRDITRFGNEAYQACLDHFDK